MDTVRHDENVAPDANKEKTLVSKMRARFETESRPDATPVSARAKKMDSVLKPKNMELCVSDGPDSEDAQCLSPLKRTLAKPKENPRRAKASKGGNDASESVLTVIRFRPCIKNAGDVDTGERSAYVDNCSVVVKTSDKKDCVYTFDDVCTEDATQEDVFERAGRKMTDAFLDGFNATIFAYGQTGSGKTHTMQGELNLHSSGRGLMPRVFSYVFQQLRQESSYEVKLSFLQIYNEKIQDLLNPFVNTKIEHVEGDLKVREGLDGVFVEGLTKTTCNNAEEALQCVVKGLKNRKVGKTAMNTESSRSHSMLTLYLTTSRHVCKLNLIDLAGSENQKTSAASSVAQQREANNINTSLTFLGQCLRDAIKVQGASHVNFRNSKLTMMLKDSLGGLARTCVIATVSALPLYALETSSTLKFASAIKLIQTQAVRRPVRPSISTLEIENGQLRESLRLLQLEVQSRLLTQAQEYEAKLVAQADSWRNDPVQPEPAPIAPLEVSERGSVEQAAESKLGSGNIPKMGDLQLTLLAVEREKDELKRAMEALEAEKAAMMQDCAEVKEDLRFMIDKEGQLQAKVTEMERQLACTIRRAAGESPDVQLVALQKEVLRLQENSQQDLKLISELRNNSERQRNDAATPTPEELRKLKEEATQLRAELRAVLVSRKILRESIGQSIELCAKLYWSQGKLMGGLDEREQLKAELAAKNAELSQLKEKCKAHTADLSKCKTERASTAQQLRDCKTLKQELAKLKTSNSELEQLKQRLASQVGQLQDELRRERSEQDELCKFAKYSEGEKQRALLTKIESEFGGKLPLDNRSRLFVKSGVLKRVSRDKKLLEYNFFLFSDVLIYAKASPKTGTPLAKEKYKLHRVMHLGLCRLVDIQADPSKDFGTQWSHPFKLISPQKSFTISCDTAADKESWMNAIAAQIEKIYAQPEGISVQVPRAADASLIESKLPHSDGAVSAEPSLSLQDYQGVQSRHPSISLLEGEAEVMTGEWPDDLTRTRTGSGSISERSRAPSLSSRLTDIAAEMPVTETEQMRAKLQASGFCQLCVRPFSLVRRKTTCLCCGAQNVCKDCCNKKAVPPRHPELKEQRVCLACYGGITKLVGHAIPRLQTTFGDA